MNKIKEFLRNKKTNRKLVYNICLIVTVFGLLFIVSGTSYALLTGSSSSDKEQIIRAGDVTLELSEYFENTSQPISVMSDTDGLLLDETYSFKLKNIGEVSARYDIKLVNEVPSDYNDGVIDDKYVKVGVEINGEEHGPFTLEEANNILDSGIIYENELISYEIRVWLNEDYEEEILDFDGYKGFFKVQVEAEQSLQEQTLTGADILISKVGTGGLERITHEGDSTLQEPFNEDIVEYRYRGATPNNYVEFNNELWRIIGVFPTDDGNGNIENRIKLIRDESIGDMRWNTILVNDWTKASLNDYLNDDYYNSLTKEAQNMIGNTRYYLGGYKNADILQEIMYNYERKISGSDYYLNSENNIISKLALIYVSDYGYASSSVCNQTLSNYDDDICLNSNWLSIDNWQWTLSQNTSDVEEVIYVTLAGSVIYNDVDRDFAARPVLSLKSNVMISGGSGTSSNPYQLSE